jgi:hypothetical protein
MGKIRELASKIRDRASRQEEELLRIIRAHAKEIVDLNRGQFDDSITATGRPLGTYKSEAYARKKGRSTVDLFDTGDFQDEMFLSSMKFPLKIFSDDEKTQMLMDKYGTDIFGLTPDNMLVASTEILKKDIAAYYRKLLTGKL